MSHQSEKSLQQQQEELKKAFLSSAELLVSALSEGAKAFTQSLKDRSQQQQQQADASSVPAAASSAASSIPVPVESQPADHSNNNDFPRGRRCGRQPRFHHFASGLINPEILVDIKNEIFSQRQREQENSQPQLQNLGAICDRCKAPTIGIRWKCLLCPDFDFCSDCEMKESVDKFHDPSHVFAKLTTMKQVWALRCQRNRGSASPFETNGCFRKRFGCRAYGYDSHHNNAANADSASDSSSSSSSSSPAPSFEVPCDAEKIEIVISSVPVEVSMEEDEKSAAPAAAAEEEVAKFDDETISKWKFFSEVVSSSSLDLEAFSKLLKESEGDLEKVFEVINLFSD